MGKLLLVCPAAVLTFACASKMHKAKKIDTKIEKAAEVSGDQKLGIKDGNMVVQKKVQMNEELRRLQNNVYSLEDKVYGHREYGSLGLHGTLKDCRKSLVSKMYGGTGKLMWTESIDRVTEKEEEWKIGVDEQEKIVGVSEEFLLDRIKRFKAYRKTLRGREDEYVEKLEVCDAALEAKKYEHEQRQKKAKKGVDG